MSLRNTYKYVFIDRYLNIQRCSIWPVVFPTFSILCSYTWFWSTTNGNYTTKNFLIFHFEQLFQRLIPPPSSLCHLFNRTFSRYPSPSPLFSWIVSKPPVNQRFECPYKIFYTIIIKVVHTTRPNYQLDKKNAYIIFN